MNHTLQCNLREMFLGKCILLFLQLVLLKDCVPFYATLAKKKLLLLYVSGKAELF